MTLLAPILEAFFTERLIGLRRTSLQTVACYRYRDAFRPLLAFAYERNGTALVPAAAGGPGRSADPLWNSGDPLRPRLRWRSGLGYGAVSLAVDFKPGHPHQEDLMTTGGSKQTAVDESVVQEQIAGVLDAFNSHDAD